MAVSMSDGRTITVPLPWFPVLERAPRDELRRYALSEDGTRIMWASLGWSVDLVDLLREDALVRFRG